MKIGHKLSLGFVGLAMLIAALGYVSLRISQNTLEKEIGESAATLAVQTLDKIQRNIYHRIENIEAHTTNPVFRELTASSNAQFETLPDPNGYIEQIENDWNCEGNELTPVMRELATNKLAERLKSLQGFYSTKYGYPLFAEIFVTNKFGANVAQTNKTTDYYQADEEWWQIGKKDGLYIGDVKLDESSGTLATDIAIRINDANGEFLGVTKAVLNIQETTDIINEAKASSKYKTIRLYLLNNDGETICSTGPYKFPLEKFNHNVHQFSKLDLPWHINYYLDQKDGEKGIIFAHAHSQKYTGFKELNLILLTETESAEVFAPIGVLRHTMLLAGVAIMGLALLASLVTYRSVVVPIAELEEATIQIAAGNLDTKLTTTSSDEIGQLANSFQRMAGRLKKTISDLNDEVNSRKQTELKLRDNEQFLDSIFNGIQDGICVLDKDLNIIKVNAYNEKLRSDAMPLVGKKCFEAYHQRHSPCPWCPSIPALRTGEQHTEVVPVPNIENLKWWMEISSFPLRDCDGNVTGVIEHVRNITERKKTEDALRESESRLRTILDNIQTGIFIVDPETHVIVDANPVAARLTGASREQLIGSQCHKYICPAEKEQCPITDLGQQVDNAERILLTRDGKKRQIIKTVVTITLGGRKHLLESFVDVTEHKRAEEALRKAEERFRTIFENTVVGLYRTSPEGRILLANPSLVKMMGYQSFEELSKLNLEKEGFDSTTPRSVFKQRMEKEGKVIGHEAIWIRRNGTKLFVCENASAIRDEQGNILYYEGTVEDITERRKTELALEKLNKDLEATIQELSRSNRQLQDFVHVAAHDLKTPVRGIGTLADWLASDYGDKLDEHGREQIRLLKARVVRIDKLIDGMLQFSKITRTRQNEQQTDLNALLTEIIKSNERLGNITIAVDSLPTVVCELEHLSQVFQNLLSNAVTFMDKPKGLIKVGCVEQGDFWRFYVCDNGPGIEQKYFDKIFRIFQTLPKGDEPETAGIGLAIVKKIVEIYGGKIWVESQPGKGSTFFFTFPKQTKESLYANSKANTAC